MRSIWLMLALALTCADTAPVAWSVGAKVRLVGPVGERVIPVDALYRDDGIHYLSRQPDEILSELILPPADATIAEVRDLLSDDGLIPG